jgi:acyl-coenzyme A thioesterase PaaI-like protein
VSAKGRPGLREGAGPTPGPEVGSACAGTGRRADSAGREEGARGRKRVPSRVVATGSRGRAVARQGYLRDLKLGPALLRRGFNVWPPFLAAGIRVERIADDFLEVDVALTLGLLNRNYFGTHFGGSLYAMADPFFALMMLHNLGPGYVVWDKAAAIRYVKPGRGTVHAHFRLTKKAVDEARRATRDGHRHEPTFHVAIVDRDGEVVAEVDKTLYIRLAPGKA